jgi:hypothetical protein
MHKELNPGQIHYLFLRELIKRHPNYHQKIHHGIKAFQIKTNQYGYLHLDIVRDDDTVIDISWNQCVKPPSKESRIKTTQTQALRYSVQPQITDFYRSREGTKLCVCAACDIPINTKGECDIDHCRTDFKDIVSNFKVILVNEGYSLPSLYDDCPVTYKPTFRAIDKELELKWIKFHSDSAVLQILCKKCHKKKTYN